jgi:hypothetical protein
LTKSLNVENIVVPFKNKDSGLFKTTNSLGTSNTIDSSFGFAHSVVSPNNSKIHLLSIKVVESNPHPTTSTPGIFYLLFFCDYSEIFDISEKVGSFPFFK